MRGLLVVVVVVWSEEKEGKRELSGGTGTKSCCFGVCPSDKGLLVLCDCHANLWTVSYVGSCSIKGLGHRGWDRKCVLRVLLDVFQRVLGGPETELDPTLATPPTTCMYYYVNVDVEIAGALPDYPLHHPSQPHTSLLYSRLSHSLTRY